MVVASQAQRNQSSAEVKSSPVPPRSFERSNTNQTGEPRGGNLVLFTEDFANGLNGNNNVNGAWTINSTPAQGIWMMANANSPAGYYSNTIAALASPSAANGWVIFDADYYQNQGLAANASNGADVSGWLQSPTLDFSNNNSVIVEWNQYFRYCCFSASPLALEVSNDNGATWKVFPAAGTFIPSANVLSANPLLTRVDISCAAAGQSQVRIRWSYANNGQTGYSHYFWGIDDVTIYENTVTNDLSVAQVTNGDIFNIWEYRVTPLAQRTLAADGGLLAGVIYQNLGINDQTGVSANVEILDANQNVIFNSTQVIGTVPSYRNTPECPSYTYDTLYIPTGWDPGASPAALGKYYVRISLSGDSTDVTPDDNSGIHDFEYSRFEYGHDNPDSLDLQVGPREQPDNPGTYDPCGYGNFFTFPNSGSTAYGLTARFGPASDPLVIFNAVLYRTNGNLNGAGEIVANKNNIEMTQGWIDASATEGQYFPFQTPYQPLTGEAYFAAVLNENEDTKQMTIRAWSNSDTDNSTASYERAGDNSFVWFGAQTWTPAVRLILDTVGWVGVTERVLNFSNLEVYPNPASEQARISFNLNGTHAIAYEVRDINGRLIEWSNLGRFSNGNNQLTLNLSGYANGQYSVGLVVDGEKMYRRNFQVIH